ncbi:MAG TPA: DEAD/DEAH box helicase [Opitutaceae bacterium]
MHSGTRVIHRERPEYGFGQIKYEELDVLGEPRLQVSFEHLDHPLTLSPVDVAIVATAAEDANAGRWGDLGELKRRLCCGLIVAENNHTGAFLRTTVQPLPHQVALLDKVLSGDRLGHLFADDVGLGKTIEAGLLITATMCANPQARVMVVCPAGLALQWQEEMDEHFSLYFEILGLNFAGDSSASWRNHRLIIAPIDRIKQDRYTEIFRSVEPFDLIVCDEAHRLNAHRDRLTKNLKKTRNFELFETILQLRAVDFVTEGGAPRSPRMVFLSATPHQGDDLRFLFLLNLLRPELFPIEGEDTSLLVASRLQEVMTRTPKSEARDWNGGLLFKGHTVQTLDIAWSIGETETSRALTNYITKAVGSSQSNAAARALVVVLVMHTFHKIAASSWHALRKTLAMRLAVLVGEARDFASALSKTEDGNESELDSAALDQAFYKEEPDALRDLIDRIDSLRTDEKWEKCAELLMGLERMEAGCRVLFFTQFKETQRYIAENLSVLFPGVGVEIINGDVPLEERRSARHRFETNSRFMISTEAGGEGVNLQRACHIMINYDWPWNPMRLQQRIGRLDRYGQKQVVRVFNLRVPNSWDEKISTRINERLAVIQKTMGEVVAADVEDYREMILGEVADQIDPAKAFLSEVRHQEFDEADLDRKLKDAIASMQRWKDRFGSHLKPSTVDPKLRPTLTADNLKEAFASALEGKNIKLQETRTSDRQFVSGVYHFDLPPEFRDSRVRPNRSLYIAFDRDRFTEVRDSNLGIVRGQPIAVNLAGFGDNFTDWLFQSATHAKQAASAFQLTSGESWKHGSGWLAVYCMRYLGSGRRLLVPDELLGVLVPNSGAGATPIPTADLFALVAQGTAVSTAATVQRLPSLEMAEDTARHVLKERIKQRGAHSKTIPGLSLWLLVRVS